MVDDVEETLENFCFGEECPESPGDRDFGAQQATDTRNAGQRMVEVHGDEEPENEERVIEEIFSKGGTDGFGPAHAMYFTVFHRIEDHVCDDEQPEGPKIEEGSGEDRQNEVCCMKGRKLIVSLRERANPSEDVCHLVYCILFYAN